MNLDGGPGLLSRPDFFMKLNEILKYKKAIGERARQLRKKLVRDSVTSLEEVHKELGEYIESTNAAIDRNRAMLSELQAETESLKARRQSLEPIIEKGKRALIQMQDADS